jgi:hypothetical protein
VCALGCEKGNWTLKNVPTLPFETTLPTTPPHLSREKNSRFDSLDNWEGKTRLFFPKEGVMSTLQRNGRAGFPPPPDRHGMADKKKKLVL